MQPLPSTANTNSDCYLQIRRGKQTIFTDVAETTNLAELKQTIAYIIKINPEMIGIKFKGQLLDTDGKNLVEYGISAKDARPQAPLQLEFLVQAEDGVWDNEEIVPYRTENQPSINEQQAMGIPMDAR
jgi:hypothetical protein